MIRANTERPARNRMMVLSLLAALMAVGLMLTAKPAHATTFTVTNTSDFTGGGLRAAINNANNTPGADTINFNISGSGVKTIRPLEALPKITEAITINGYSQPGATINTLAQGTNANLLIELDLANAGGLEIRSQFNTVVRGLVINNSPGSSVSIRSGTSNRIEGNFIGTDASGTLDQDNFGIGAQIDGGSNNPIGGTSPAKRNLISANGLGIEISSNGTGDNVVQGNLIGTQKDGISPLGNSSMGVYVDTSDNTIGGTGLGEANVIAFNDDQGMFVEFVGVANIGNRISANSIFSNGDLGIDLRGGTEDAAGATANDPKDPDQGANDLQNKPVITSAKTVGGTTTIQAKLNSTPTDPFVIEFFSNPSGEDEGKKFIGNKAVSTNSNGNVTFSFSPSQVVAAGQRITATATNVADANTSEFSAPRTVVQG